MFFYQRGWTTWLLGAADSRVEAMAPLVLSLLNTNDVRIYRILSYWSNQNRTETRYLGLYAQYSMVVFSYLDFPMTFLPWNSKQGSNGL